MRLQNRTALTLFIVIAGLYLGHISTDGTKTQGIRLLDVFLIGPLMIYFGHVGIKATSIFSLLLIFFGATTITYNLKNYIYASK
jgi:uncharacterized membrane protein